MKLQRHVRGYLARKNYEKMKNSALVIQSAYRGWVVRRKYTKLRKGVVAVQSLYKMRRQQAIYGEMKTELQRRKEIDAANRARQVFIKWFYYCYYFSFITLLNCGGTLISICIVIIQHICHTREKNFCIS